MTNQQKSNFTRAIDTADDVAGSSRLTAMLSRTVRETTDLGEYVALRRKAKG
ncbi:MAG: hypothetical protein ACOH2L_16375 [Devosia sp.]